MSVDSTEPPNEELPSTSLTPAEQSVPVQEEIDPVVLQRKFDKYVERAEKMIEQLTERQSISGQEFDKQIVALAGGGLALTITLSKDILDKGGNWIGVLLACWLCFLLSLVVNLISHQVSTRHYTLMIDRHQYYLDCAEDSKDIDDKLDDVLKKRIDIRTTWVKALNLTALISCSLAIALFLIFTFHNIFTFKHHTDDKARTPDTNPTAVSHPRPHQRANGNDSTAKSSSAPSAAHTSTTKR